ncbi:hypothetical protein [Lapidilactobacillus luobeiensis]|uniref:hypothetical protein n=1 Tax=Lapidilactobacillus luobeiensis TaxID=2950371 RepID=UPI0021C3D7D5|nr:hypothetical protein [Lapidilactobacillus luobeiensis]
MARRKTKTAAREPDLIIDLERSTAADATVGRRSERLRQAQRPAAEPLSRVTRREAQQESNSVHNGGHAHPKMRRRLNWALVIVSLLIVLTYLALFFL